MGVKTSAEAVRGMGKTMQDTIKAVNSTNAKMAAMINKSKDWNDEKGEAYRKLLQNIVKQTEVPIAEMKKAQTNLQNLAAILDRYNKTKI